MKKITHLFTVLTVFMLGIMLMSIHAFAVKCTGGHTPGPFYEADYVQCVGGWTIDYYMCADCETICDEYGIPLDPNRYYKEGNGVHTPGVVHKANYIDCTGGYTTDFYTCANCHNRCDINGNAITPEWKEGTGIHTPGEYTAPDYIECTGGYIQGFYTCENCSGQCDENGNALTPEWSDGTGIHTPGEFRKADFNECMGGWITDYYICTACGWECDADGNVLMVNQYEEGNGEHTPGETHPADYTDCNGGFHIEYYICTVCSSACDIDGNALTRDPGNGKHTPGDYFNANYAECSGGWIIGHYICSICKSECDIDGATLNQDRYYKSGTGAHIYEEGICIICDKKDPNISYDVNRIFGNDRCETARMVANTMKATATSKFNNILYTSGDNFADALAGSYLSAKHNAPILLYRTSDAANNLAYIKNNLVSGGTVYILGGPSAVPESVENELKTAGIRVTRLAGNNRFLTNLAVLQTAGFNGGKILVCTGYNFADSLSASATGLPILLVHHEWTKLSAEYEAYLKQFHCDFIIVGGPNAVSAELESSLRAHGTVKRLAGTNRYDTSVRVAKEFFAAPDHVVLAYAQNFPDGLCGGALAYSIGAPLILISDGAEAQAATYVRDHSISSGTVLGGTRLIPYQSIVRIFS